MAKKSSGKRNKAAPADVAAPLTGKADGGSTAGRVVTAPVPSGEANKQSGPGRFYLIGAAALAVILLVGAMIWFLARPSQAGPEAKAAADDGAAAPEAVEAAAAPAPDWPAGAANRCFSGPRFPKQVGFEAGQSFIGTSAGQYVGLFLADASGSGRDYQHPTWDDAGNMGAFAYDGAGNIYLTPAPFMNLHIDRLENQTKLYRVDTDSAEMSLLLELPAASPPSAANPHGLVGLFYDCDTHSLYVSSVAGSTAQQEQGRIFQVDLKSEQIVSSYEQFDAMGVGVYNGRDGKRLYFGSGRTTGVYSLALDGEGHFVGEPRLEFYLAAQDGGRNDKAARLTFNEQGQLIVKGLDFHYTLSVERPVIYRDYIFNYDGTDDAWELAAVEQRTK